MRAGVFTIFLACSCASTQKPPPGTALEHPLKVAEEEERNTVSESTMPGSSSELAQAFEAPVEEAPESKPAPAPPPQNATAEPVDELSLARADFEQRLSDAKQLSGAEQEQALAGLERDAPKVSP